MAMLIAMALFVTSYTFCHSHCLQEERRRVEAEAKRKAEAEAKRLAQEAEAQRRAEAKAEDFGMEVGLSENRLNPYTQWLMIIIPILNGYNWEYTLFSDKPRYQRRYQRHQLIRITI